MTKEEEGQVEGEASLCLALHQLPLSAGGQDVEVECVGDAEVVVVVLCLATTGEDAQHSLGTQSH